MSWLNIFRRRVHQRDMDLEMRFHVDMEAAELERAGLDPGEARRRALAAFGGVRRHQEEGHEARGGAWLEDLLRDLRYAARSLRHTPGYAATVLLTIAIGVAANTSIFSVARAILFKPLPYRDPGRLMVLWDGLDWIGVPEAWVTGPEVTMLRRETRSFEGFAAIRSGSAALTAAGGGEPEQVPVSLVSANFFQILGTGPTLGRGFAPGEDAPGAPAVAVISRRLWTQRFGADSAVLGRTIMIDGTATRVIGVLPASFGYRAQNSLGSASGAADVYTALPDTLDRLPRTNHSIGVLARVRRDVPEATARAELEGLSRRLDEQQYGKGGFKFVPVMLQERMVREVRPALLVLLGAVAMVILIMGANLAVLALVRAARREHEMVVRRAIGAGSGRVARQVLTETLLLALAGALTGTLLGRWALHGLLWLAPPGLPRRAEIGVDLSVLAVTLGVAVAVGMGMGLASVAHSVRGSITAVLREKAPSHAGTPLRRALVLVQVALSVVLLAGTGLLLGSFVRLLEVDPGFDPDHVLTVELRAPEGSYPRGRPVFNVFQRYADALRAMPGVRAVGGSSAPPLSSNADQWTVRFPGAPGNTGNTDQDRLLVDVGAATPGYFQAMGIELVAGREFDRSNDDSTGARAAIIDEALARRFFPGLSPVGRMMLADDDTLRIAGVARHIRMYTLEDTGREQIWLPHALVSYRYLVLAARTSGEPLALAAAARTAIHGVDPGQPIIAVSTMRSAIGDSLAQRRLVLILVGGFAAAALLLAGLGVYGVASTTVAQRTRELGIRMALGADRRRVIREVLSGPARLVAFGLLLGLAGTWPAGRAVQRLLYGVTPMDPIVLGGVSLLLVAVAVLAGYLPARRATRVDPMIALKAE
jgi:predicted permease